MTLLFRCFALLMVFASQSVFATAPVWKISKGDNHFYLGGTIHILSSEDYPLPNAFSTAYADVNTVVFETDMAEIGSPEFQQKMLQGMMLPPEQTLESLLLPETYARLATFFAERGVDVNNFMQFKPSMVSIIMTVIEIERLGLSGMGVDEYYSLKAENDAKSLGELETAEEQLAYIVSMAEGEENAVIAYTLDDLTELELALSELKSAWRTGDSAKLEQLIIAEMKASFADVYQRLIVERNQNWMPQLEAFSNTSEPELVLVGAGHLVGEDGLLQQLSRKGFVVEQLD